MLLASDAPYLSLEPFNPPVELPDFVVLSGLNGSGKSHLLSATTTSADPTFAHTGVRLIENGTQLEPVRSVTFDFLISENSLIENSSLRRYTERLFSMYQADKSKITSASKDRTSNIFPSASNNFYSPRLGERQSLHQEEFELILEIAEGTGKDPDNLSSEDFDLYYPLNDWNRQNDIFQHNFSKLFTHYQLKKFKNDLNRFRNASGRDVKFLSDDDFIQLNGEPPWLLVNKILEEANLGYQVTFPHESDSLEVQFQVELVNQLNGATVGFTALSSGEKVIMSMALSHYNAKFDAVFPKVLVMDEPDAHLHPLMTKQFLDVIQNVFVKEKGVKVIMTTHSPSTVALAPEASLFLMNKTAPRITKATKDQALRLLTSGVPTLSINYENRRQVFVESKYDVKFYEKLKRKLIPEITINFIASGVGGQGSCDQVKEVVNKLSSYGNRSVYGIIDWDTRNDGNGFVKVIGRGKRYSIENYILDPIILAAFLVRERFIDRATLSLDENDTHVDFRNFEEAKLQIIADYIVDRARSTVGSPVDEYLQEVEYVNGNKIKLPNWYLHLQGHQLEEKIKQLFPQLKRYTQEGQLKQEIIDKVVEDIPGLIPTDILAVFKEIQNFDQSDRLSKTLC